MLTEMSCYPHRGR